MTATASPGQSSASSSSEKSPVQDQKTASSSKNRSPVRGWRRSPVDAKSKDTVRAIARRIMPHLYEESPKEDTSVQSIRQYVNRRPANNNRSPVRGWRRSSVDERSKATVRSIAKRVFPSLYESDDAKKKPPPKSRKMNPGASCRDECCQKPRNNDDDDDRNGSRAKQSFYTFHSAEDSMNEKGKEVPKTVDAYTFREEDNEEVVTMPPTANNVDSEDCTSEEVASISANLGSSVMFHNPELSTALGALNNPFRSTGWVKMHCGGVTISKWLAS